MGDLIQSKIQELIGDKINDYTHIKGDYETRFNEKINRDPLSSIEDFPLKECKYKVSIIIPSWNSVNTLLLTLTTIENTYICKNFSKKIEVIVVDDGSDDTLAEEIKTKRFNFYLKYIKQVHLGRAQAINMGVKNSTGDILLFCDADVLLFPFTIDELIKRQQEYIDETIFFGFREDVKFPRSEQKKTVQDINDYISKKNPNFWLDNRFKADCPGSWGENMMLETNMLQKLSVRNNLWVSDNKTSMYDCWQLYRMVYGFLFTVSKKNFESVGGFCEDLVDWGYDDTFFTALCIEKNIKIVPVPSAHCLHIWHDIRKPTQWEDGRKNRERMNEYFVMPKRTSYLDKDFEERKICEYKFDLTNQVNIVTSKYKLPNFSKLKKARIHYKLGNLEESFTLYNKVEEKLRASDYESYFDIIIRLNKESEFRYYNNEYKEYSRYYYFILARYYFTKELDLNNLEKMNVESRYMKYLFNISREEHMRRAEQYFYSEQWYLSLRDFFAAYLLGIHSAKKKCNSCINKIKSV